MLRNIILLSTILLLIPLASAEVIKTVKLDDITVCEAIDDYPKINEVADLINDFITRFKNENINLQTGNSPYLIQIASNDISANDPPNGGFCVLSFASFERNEDLIYNYIKSNIVSTVNPDKIITFDRISEDNIIVVKLIRSDDRTETNSGNQEPDTQTKKNPEPEITLPSPTTNCGLYSTHIKLCYNSNKVFPYDPSDFENTIKKYVETTKDNSGYLIITTDSNTTTQSRTEKITSQLTAELRINNLKPLHVVKTITSLPGDEQEAILVVAKNKVNDLPGEFSTIKNTFSNINIEEESLNDWKTRIEQLKDSLENPIKQLYDRTGIQVHLVTVNEPLDEESLSISLDNNTLSGTNIKIESCHAYIIIDPEKTILYENQYCGLKIPSYVLQKSTREDQPERIINAALQHTKPIDPEELLLIANKLLSKEASDIYSVNTAKSIIKWFTENKKWLEKTYPGQDFTPSTNVISARISLLEGNYEDAINLVDQNFEKALDKIKPIAAHTAVQAASAMGDCNLINKMINAYVKYVPRGYSTVNQAYKQLRECQFNQARKNCEDFNDHRTTPLSLFDTSIVLINDDMAERTFSVYADYVKNYILDTQGIKEYKEKLRFYKVSGLTVELLTANNELDPPHFDNKFLQLTTSACKADIAIVLSEKEFLPVTYKGGGRSNTPAGFVSISACNEVRSCVGIYSLRSLALGLYKLPPEENTVTAKSILGSSSTLVGALSTKQKEAIKSYYERGVR